ncbi:MAG: hypothetical protein QXP36_03635 [Conexivisphaerales archaeon]
MPNEITGLLNYVSEEVIKLSKEFESLDKRTLDISKILHNVSNSQDKLVLHSVYAAYVRSIELEVFAHMYGKDIQRLGLVDKMREFYAKESELFKLLGNYVAGSKDVSLKDIGAMFDNLKSLAEEIENQASKQPNFDR